MKKRIILGTVAIIAMIIVGAAVSCNLLPKEETYASSKADALRFYEKNKDKLNSIAADCYDNKTEGNAYKKVKYGYSDHAIPDLAGVVFEMDAQGMLGGQYWGLIYCPDYRGEDLLITGGGARGEGNNVFIYAEIEENWFFYYEDWDGKVDTTKIE